MVSLFQICASVAGASLVWSLSLIVFRDYFKKRFPATLTIASTFLFAINFAPIILIISAFGQPTSFIHFLFVLSTFLSVNAPIFCVLFVSLLRKNVITWWALVFALICCSTSMFGFVPGATLLVSVVTPLGNILMLNYTFPYGLCFLLTGYISNIVGSGVILVYFLHILRIRGLKREKSNIRMFLFNFIIGNLIIVVLNLIKRNYPEIYGIDTLAWSLFMGVVLIIYRRNQGIFYMIPAVINHIIITTKNGLVITSYDCVQRVDREKEKEPTYGGQLLHTMSQVLQQSLNFDAEITAISSPKGIVMFEHGVKFSIYIIVDTYSTLWNLLLKQFANDLDRQFDNFIDTQGNIATTVPNLEPFVTSKWEQYFPVKSI